MAIQITLTKWDTAAIPVVSLKKKRKLSIYLFICLITPTLFIKALFLNSCKGPEAIEGLKTTISLPVKTLGNNLKT